MMKRLLCLAALLSAGPVFAQSDLGDTDRLFRSDLETVARLTATVGLIHEQTGEFPATPFEILGNGWAQVTGLRDVPLSTITVTPSADGVRVTYNPLPKPYVSDDLLAEVDISARADGTYLATHELRRRADLDRGGRSLAYDRTATARVDEAGGTLCVNLAVVRDLLDTGRFAAALPDLVGDGIPVEVRALDASERLLYTSDATDA